LSSRNVRQQVYYGWDNCAIPEEGTLARSSGIFAAAIIAAIVLQSLLLSAGGAMWSPFATAGDNLPSPTALTIDFSFSPAKPVTGESVTFTATVSGNGTPPFTYGWTFGDSSSGSGSPVSKTYSSAGTRTVTLTVTDPDPPPGQTATTSKSIVVASPVNADFTFTPSNPVVGQTVTFSGTASGGFTPYTFSWTFGDGTTGSGQSVGHAFPSASTFTVTLTVTDSGGPPVHTDQRSRSVTVIPALTADFSYSPSNPVVDQTVSFSATASGGSTPYTFSWNFGDAGTASGQNRNHAYSTAGTFTVTLTVTDAASRIVAVSKFITVSGVVAAGFTFSPPSPVISQSVSFSATATGGTPPYTFNWAFGDGATGSGQSVSHTYLSAADFTVTLTVSDTASHVTTVTKVVSVTAALTADFTFAPTNPAVGQSVSFTATATGGTPPYTYAWTFGDGGSGSGQTISHTYTTGGSFSVRLTLTDSLARSVQVTKPLTIASAITASFTYAPAAPSTGELVTFTATVSGGTPPYTYSWTFGDGGAGQGQVVSRPYASAGTFTVILTVTDIAQGSATVSKSIVVTAALAASFTYVPANPVVGELVNFSATASGGTPPLTLGWTFGDGGTGSGATPIHTYATAAAFTVTLRVNDAVGHSLLVSQQLVITPRLAADFTFTPVDPVVLEDVYFIATATGGTGPYAYTWTWGDGSTGIGGEPAHVYMSARSFRVNLTVSDSVGHGIVVSKVVPVSPALETNITLSQGRPMAGEVIRFTANATGGSPPYTFVWNFGDETNASGPSVLHAYLTDGTYEATATATDASGRRGVARMELPVTPALSANFTPPLTAAVGDRIILSADVEGGTEPYLVTWTFGDGGTGMGFDVNHSYAVPGTFNVTVTVTDSANHTASRSKSVLVASPLSASAIFSPPRPAVGDTITFTANATGGTPPYRYSWTFGDGGVGSGPMVTHFYINVTSYNVSVNITDSVGRFVVLRLVVLTTTNLRVDFAFDPGLPITGRPITFLPTVSGGVPPFTYTWTFGDGSSSTEERPSHLYGDSGLTLSYSVELTVCDAEGHCVTASKGITLVDWPQIANIGIGIAIASVITLWLVRRWRIGELDLKPAGRWVGQQASTTTRWVGKQASTKTRGFAAWVRGMRNGRGRRLFRTRRDRRNGRLKG